MKENCIFHILYVPGVKISLDIVGISCKNFRKVDFSREIFSYWWRQLPVSQCIDMNATSPYAHVSACANFHLHVYHANFHLRFHARTCNPVACLRIVLNSETETIFASYHVCSINVYKCVCIHTFIFSFNIHAYMHAYKERKKRKKRLCLYYFVFLISGK
jgi:hypothetical protein